MSLVAHYPMNVASGTIVPDVSGSSNPATSARDVGLFSVVGKPGLRRALDFNGTSDILSAELTQSIFADGENYTALAYTDLLDDGVTTFGALLTDSDGELVVHGDDANLTWMYWVRNYDVENKYWATYAQEFNLDTQTLIGDVVLVKDRDAGCTQAIAHHVMYVSDGLYVMKYSKWPVRSTVRIATCATPNGSFVRVAGQEITAVDAWEFDLEANNAFYKLTDTETELTGWYGYENMGGNGAGEQAYFRAGWIEIAVNKSTGAVILGNRHALNPLNELLFGSETRAYGLSNIPTSTKIGNCYLCLYFTRDASAVQHIAAAVSTDPLFLSVVEKRKLVCHDYPGTPEKFHWHIWNDKIYIIFEISAAYRIRILELPVPASLLSLQRLARTRWQTASATVLAPVVSESSPASGTYCLLFDDQSTGTALGSMIDFDPQTVKFSYEISVRANQQGDFYILAGDSIAIPGSIYNTATRAVDVRFRSTGQIAYVDGGGTHDLRAYTADQYYTVKLIIDVANQTYDIYVDDNLEQAAAAFRSAEATITSISFTTSTSGEVTAAIDDIEVRTYDSALLDGVSVAFWADSHKTNYTANGYVVSMWEYATNQRMWAIVANASDDDWRFFVSPDGTSAGNDNHDTGQSIEIGRHHVCFTFDNSTHRVEFYYDGVHVGGETLTTGYVDMLSSLTVGGLLPIPSNFFDGPLDDVRVEAGVWSAHQVAAIFADNEECEPWQRLVRRPVQPLVQPLIGAA